MAEGVSAVLQLCEKHNIRVDVGDKAISKVALKDNTYVVGVFKKYLTSLDVSSNHVVLDRPSNTGNVGTVIRTMLGFGYKNIVLIKPCIDFFDPMVIRSSMGASFGVSYAYYSSVDDYMSEYGSHTLYPFTLRAKNSLSTVSLTRPYSLLFGNEGSGLDSKFDSYPTSIRIDHSSLIDSLNLSVSVALALYEFSKPLGDRQ